MKELIASANQYASPENQRFAELLHGSLSYSLELAAADDGQRYWLDQPRCKLILDDDGQVTDASFRTETLVGYNPPEDQWSEYDPRDIMATLLRSGRSIATGQENAEQVTLRRNDGARRSFMAGSKHSHPADVIQLFAAHASNTVQAEALLDEILSETLLGYLSGTTRRPESTVGTAIGKRLAEAENNEAIQVLQLRLLKELYGDDEVRAAQVQKVVDSLSNTVMDRLNSGDIPLHKATLLLEPFVLCGALGDKIGQIRLFHYGAESPADELLLEWLVANPEELSQAEQDSNIVFAKKYIQRVLTRYGQDPQRNQGNVRTIQKLLFPDVKRPDSLSRDTLVGLSNGIIASQNAQRPPDAQIPLLDKSKNASVGEAFRRLLRITSAKDIDQDTFDTHRREDMLQADIIGLLFDPQSVEAVTERQPQQVQHTGSQAVRAFMLSQQKPDKKISGYRLRQPGYGHMS